MRLSTESDDSPHISAASVRAAVERIVSSPDFDGSDRARDFLRYVVEETLEGRADRIKAFSVAVEVFGRNETFDAQNDPVVRIEAGRLRRSLERYYLLDGKSDPIVIEIPKGGYVPVFGARSDDVAGPAPVPSVDVEPSPERPARKWRVSHAVAAVALVGAIVSVAVGLNWHTGGAAETLPPRPSLLVLPFENLGSDAISEVYSIGLTDEIVSELARFKEISVFGVQTSRSLQAGTDVETSYDDLKVSYVLEGSVRTADQTIRVNSRLIDARTKAVIWTERYEHPLTAHALFSIQAATAEEVVTAIAQPYGIVFRAEAANQRVKPVDDLDAYLCTLSYYVYRANPSAGGHRKVRKCLEAAIAMHPTYATAWAMLALVYVDEGRADFNESPGAVERAIRTAREAVRLDPRNTRSLQALSMALFYGGDASKAIEIGEKAIAMNPHDTELLGQIGLQIGLAGETERGRVLLERALEKNPGHTNYYRGCLATIAYMQEDYEAALRAIDDVDLSGLPIFHGVAAIVYAQNGLDGKARTMVRRFQEMAPDFIPNLWAELEFRNIPVGAQLIMAEGLRKAGATVPDPPHGAAAYRPRLAGDSKT